MDYQVGAHFKALNEGVLVAALKFIGYFFAIKFSLPDRDQKGNGSTIVFTHCEQENAIK